jgi:signal transduction histidine kinase
MSLPLLTLEVRLEPDIVLARQRARQIASLIGFAPLDQTRIATAISEIARNSFLYAGGGRVEFLLEPGPPPGFLIRVRERGPGIKDLQVILDGHYVSPTGLGLGILGSKRLMDRFEIESSETGSTVTMVKTLNGHAAFSPKDLARISAELAQHKPQGLLEELQMQNQELLRILEELRERQSELAELHTRELQETNRGVVALYSELDENAIELKRISDLKSRFLSNMSHEFRSPLNTILSMSGFLLDGSSGVLTDEQTKEIGFIKGAAEGLSGLVNDLLDLAKVEAGKAVLRVERFEVANLFESLRGTINPLLARGSVALVIEEPVGIGTMETDEGKLAQILRNFLSNAAKFTQQGEIRLSAKPGFGDTVVFEVSDTGIGIAAEDQRLVFEEFSQIDNPVQKQVKGTGLGLPLSKKLAELLGGSVSLRSEPGVGSAFVVTIPRSYGKFEDQRQADDPPGETERVPTILIIDDDEADRYLLKSLLVAQGRFAIVESSGGEEGLRMARDVQPDVIFLDLVMPGMPGIELLGRLKSDEKTRSVPVIFNTSADLSEEDRRRITPETAAILSKFPGNPEASFASIRDALLRAGVRLTHSGTEM